jgi:hypothetical protein
MIQSSALSCPFSKFMLTSLLFATLFMPNLAGQRGYEITHGYTGARETLYNNQLNNEAKRLQDTILNRVDDTLAVIGHAYYPLLAYTRPHAYFEETFQMARVAEVANRNFYILIAKHLQENGSLAYKLELKLPDAAPYNTLTPMERKTIEADVLIAILNNAGPEAPVENNADAEMAGLKKLRSYVEQIHGGTLQLENVWQKSGFEQVAAVAPGETISRGLAGQYSGVVGSSGDAVYDFAGLEMSVGNQTTILREDLAHGATEAIGPDSVFQSINRAYIITDDFNTTDELIAAAAAFEGSSHKIVVWFHHSATLAGDSMRVQARNNLTLAESEAMVNYYFEEMLRRWYPDEYDVVLARRHEHESIVKTVVDPECGLDWQWGKKCLLAYADGRPDIAQFPAGFGIGMLDGLLGTIQMLYESADGVFDSVTNFFSRAWAYGKDCWVHFQKNQSIWSVFEKVGEDARETIKEQWDSVVETYKGFQQMIQTLADVELKPLLNRMVSDIETYFIDLITGQIGPAYDVGVIGFEVVLAVFTGGASAAVKTAGKAGAKFLPKILKFLKKLDQAGSGAFKDLLETTFSKAGKRVGGKIENPKAHRKSLLCRIGLGGCFIAGTPVLLAAGLVPIDSVQLMDYAVAHQTINQPADPEAYDPFTSAQQRERDQYTLDSTNWYEVTFEPLNSSSYCRLALHQRWMMQNGISEVGQIQNLSLPEQGITGPSRITSIKHILPQKRPVDNDGNDSFGLQPITGIFVHQSDDVWTLEFDNGDTLGITYNHPIYSLTANDWRLAGELTIGETVLSRTGTTTLAAKKQLPGQQQVWNLEVREFHNFLVGESGVLVHNSCGRHKKRYYQNDGKSQTPIEHLQANHSYKNRGLPENQKKSFWNDTFDDSNKVSELMDDLLDDVDPIWNFKPGSNDRVLRALIDSSNPKYARYLKVINGVPAFGIDKNGRPLTKFFMDIIQENNKITFTNGFPIK